MAEFDPEDFMKLTMTEDKAETEALVKKIFAVVDKDHNGALDKQEMTDMMKQFATYMCKKSNEAMPSNEEIEEVAQQGLAEMDENADGKVTEEEFLKYAFRQNNCE